MWSTQTGSAVYQDTTIQITMQRAFTMTLDATDALEQAYGAAGLPLVNDLYPGTVAVFCTSLAPLRISPILAQVTCTYQGSVGRGGISDTPIGAEPSIEWGGITTDEAIDQDWNGKAIVTVNNEPIDGLTERLTDDTVTIERNFLTINRYALRAYRRAVNSDVFLDWPPGTARMIDDNAKAVFINGVIKYWKVRAVFQFREPFRTTAAKAWYKRVRHEGYLVRDSAGDDPHIAWDEKTKTPVTRPILLKADGTRETDPNAAHWLEIQTLNSLPFNALGLT
jgi:hypothetical protein